MTYYSLYCPYAPDCSFHTVGNSKRFMEEGYFNHYMQEHYHKPIIQKYEKEIVKMVTKQRRRYLSPIYETAKSMGYTKSEAHKILKKTTKV